VADGSADRASSGPAKSTVCSPTMSPARTEEEADPPSRCGSPRRPRPTRMTCRASRPPTRDARAVPRGVLLRAMGVSRTAMSKWEAGPAPRCAPVRKRSPRGVFAAMSSGRWNVGARRPRKSRRVGGNSGGADQQRLARRSATREIGARGGGVLKVYGHVGLSASARGTVWCSAGAGTRHPATSPHHDPASGGSSGEERGGV